MIYTLEGQGSGMWNEGDILLTDPEYWYPDPDTLTGEYIYYDHVWNMVGSEGSFGGYY